MLVAVLSTTPAVATTADSSADRAIAQAQAAFGPHRAELAVAQGDTFKVERTVVDANGGSHVRYSRTYQGLRVYGGDVVVHNRPDGTYAGSSVGLAAPLNLSVTPSVTAGAAAAKARAHFTGKVGSVGAAELLVDATSGVGKLAYEVVVQGLAPDGQLPSVLHVLVDATTGDVLAANDEIMTIDGTGNSLYAGTVTISTTQSGSQFTLTDPTHGNGFTCDMNNTGNNSTGTGGTCSTMNDADNVWGNGANSSDQSAAVDAHYGAALTFDYYKNVHGRNGIFGNGQGVPSRVHFGQAFVNAFWDGSSMTYGDGAGNARPLTAIDVAGHEMSHGVTEALAGLVYSGESGGLNEATSDIFGTMVEFSANNTSDPGDYLIGEEININGNGTPLRWMYNPSLDGASHSCWSTSTKNVDVHFSSGVANHFFFDLAEGTGSTPFGTSPVCGSAPAVTGIGRTAAAAIWYRALDVYFTTSTSYVNTTTPSNTARAYTLRAATDLYGQCSTQYKAVQAAWTAVNVAGNDAACPSGNDFSLTLSPTSASVNPGGSVTSTAATAVTNGSAQTVTFSASGLPAGASASFSPTSVTAGGSSTLTITTAGSTPAGTYPVTVTGTGTSATHTATFTLTVNGPAGCSATNPTDVTIPDNTTVTSTVTISGCTGNASSTSTVEVHIVHTYRGDLVVSLVAPDGTAYTLLNRSGGSADNVDQTFTVNLSSEVANGTWTLRVQDAATLDTGFINSWTLNLGGGGGPGPCTGTNGTDVTIPDNTTVTSTIALSGCTGNASSTSTAEVHIVHTYRGDLVVSLVAPDGSVYTLLNRSGGSADNVDQTFTVNLSSEVRNGTWTLRVQDAATLDTGFINSWTLTL